MYRDRSEAGRELGRALQRYSLPDAVVLALPRGGVPVAVEVARALDAPLDVLLVRKIGHPAQPELGLGALGEHGALVLNRDLIARADVSERALGPVIEAESREVERRGALYRRGRQRVPLAGRTAIIVDDGLATGYTARAALEIVRAQGAARAVIAVPVAPPDTVRELERVADLVVAVDVPEMMMSVGYHYQDFHQLTDDEVASMLATIWPEEIDVLVSSCGRELHGTLSVPAGARGIVLFAHGSGSSYRSPRNRAVAAHLNEGGLATLLFDLLTPDEASDRSNVFDIPLLGARLVGATEWLRTNQRVATLAVGYFGASTGAGAALWAAAELGPRISAVVSRGGRPDLAGAQLERVSSPTLLIVGSLDAQVLELNEQARARLRCPAELAVVPGATHLFEEPGTLEAVADLARTWFERHLDRASDAA